MITNGVSGIGIHCYQQCIPLFVIVTCVEAGRASGSQPWIAQRPRRSGIDSPDSGDASREAGTQSDGSCCGFEWCVVDSRRSPRIHGGFCHPHEWIPVSYRERLLRLEIGSRGGHSIDFLRDRQRSSLSDERSISRRRWKQWRKRWRRSIHTITSWSTST